jgi:hypothetical protein
MSNNIASLSAKSLRRAASLKERIDTLSRDLARLLGGPDTAPRGRAAAPRTVKRRRGGMSRAARKRQAERMRKRWAKAKAAGKSAL